MAFTGSPVVKKVRDNCYRITGVSLAAGASGTIGFSDKSVAAEVGMHCPDWKAYHLAEQDGGAVSLQDAVKVDVEAAGVVAVVAVPIAIVKTGTTHLDFVITLTNPTTGGGAVASDALEIYVTWKGE